MKMRIVRLKCHNCKKVFQKTVLHISELVICPTCGFYNSIPLAKKEGR
mgnify:CR=1 FL=1